MKLFKQFIATITLICVSLAPTSAFSAQLTQLGFILDASGSISDYNYNLLRSGLSDALAAIDADGSVEITVTSFGASIITVVAPTMLTVSSLPNIQNAILTHTKVNGGTPTGAAITYTANLMTSSSLFSNPTLAGSIINLATDGQPTGGAAGQAAAENAAAAAYAAGIDALSIEAIGSGVNSGAALANMMKIVFPNPSTLLPINSTNIPNPMGGSWVVPVSDFDALAPILKAKVIASVKPPVTVPDSSSLALLVIGLIGLGFARRRV